MVSESMIFNLGHKYVSGYNKYVNEYNNYVKLFILPTLMINEYNNILFKEFTNN